MDLSVLSWVALGFGAFVIGLSKVALPGAGMIAIVLFATVLPARESTGAILLLLIIGDLFALRTYWRHAELGILLRLLPAVVVGLVIGVVFIAFSSDEWVRRTIGVIILFVVVVTVWGRNQPDKEPAAARPAATAFYGAMGGFTTMAANIGGPIMSMYFIASRLDVQAFLGTGAWLFAVANVVKVPFSVGLGLITIPTVLVDLLLVPAVIIGAIVGRAIAHRISQRLFDRVVIVLTVLGALYLLLPQPT